MLFENEEDDRRAREAFQTLFELSEGNDEYFLLIALIRMFHQVKTEYREEAKRKRERELLRLVKH